MNYVQLGNILAQDWSPGHFFTRALQSHRVRALAVSPLGTTQAKTGAEPPGQRSGQSRDLV